MAIQTINIGVAPNDGTGDDPRTAGQKINNNFQSLLMRGAPKNLIINGDFSVNQRTVSGVVILSPGEYGHDRFKAGSGGCTYTFGSAGGITTITITAGTLAQTIETNNNPALTVSLSWVGTAQGRINGGAYGDSGITETTSVGSNTIAEFNIGTFSHAQIEIGDVATDFEFVHPADQLARCKRYFERLNYVANSWIAMSQADSTTTSVSGIEYTEKRGIPTVSEGGVGSIATLTAAGAAGGGTASFTTINITNCLVSMTAAAGLVAGNASRLYAATSSMYIDIDAEL